MIKKLRIKFIVLAMLAVLLVLGTIMGTINVLNYRSVSNNADRILNTLAENDGTFPEFSEEKAREEREDQDAILKAELKPSENKNNSADKENPFRKPGLSAETPFESRYFSATITENGKITQLSVAQIAAVDKTQARKYLRQANSADEERGFIGNYRYLKVDSDDGTLIILLDCTHSLTNYRSFLIASMEVSLFGFLAVLMLVIFFSGVIIRPVAESYEKQKRFITDAGHEIKTPLAIIAADASVIEMDNGESEWTDDIRKQTERLAELTNNLVYLSRMEEQQKGDMTMLDFPISDVVSDMAQGFASRAKLEDKVFTQRISSNIYYKGDEEAIRKLTSILLDNAFKYSNEGGEIRLTLERYGSKGVRLMVFNSCDHVSKADLGHLFDRFYRTDKSRNSQTGGHGIGLSIARAIAQQHNGRISASTEDEKSLLITVQLG